MHAILLIIHPSQPQVFHLGPLLIIFLLNPCRNQIDILEFLRYSLFYFYIILLLSMHKMVEARLVIKKVQRPINTNLPFCYALFFIVFKELCMQVFHKNWNLFYLFILFLINQSQLALRVHLYL
jgi:hypothetical protein